jgi:hypothetical protein
MQTTKRWIVIGATGTLGLGLVAGGATAAAHAVEIRAVRGTVQVDRAGTSFTSTPVSTTSSSATSAPAAPAFARM